MFNKKWHFFSIFAGILFASNLLLRKWLFNNNFTFEQVMIPFTFIWGILLIIYSLYLCKNCNWDIFPKNNSNTQKVLIITLLASIVVTTGVHFNARSWKVVDNGARAETMIGPFRLIFMYFFSIFAFGYKFLLKHLCGIFLSLIGLSLIK